MPMWQERYRTWNDAGRKPRRPPPSPCAGACKTYLRVQQLTPACYGSCGPFWRDCLPLLRPLGLLRDLRPQGTSYDHLGSSEPQASLPNCVLVGAASTRPTPPVTARPLPSAGQHTPPVTARPLPSATRAAGCQPPRITSRATGGQWGLSKS